MKRRHFKLCLVTVMSIVIICSMMPVRALCVVKTEKLSVLKSWNGQSVASEVYSVQRLPVKSKEITSDRVSQQSFVEQIKSEQPYEENCILVTIAHEYSIPNQLFGVQSFPELEVISVEDLTYFDNLHNEDVVELINPNEFRQILKIKLKPVGEDTVSRAIAALENRPEIRYVGPNYIYEWDAATVPNEFLTMSTQDQCALNLIDAPLAWEITTGNSATKIGILDDGFYDHPDYRANRVATKNYSVSPPTDNVEDPDSYHGTYMAGVIGATGNNGIGTTGVCWDVSMYFVKYVNIEVKENGHKSYTSSTENLARAFCWFTDNGVSLVNWSLKRGTDQQLRDAISNYYGLVCVAAGNDGADNGEHNDTSTLARLPYDNILCVAALNAAGTGLATHVDWNEELASNYNVESVDLAAPGTYTYTTTGTNGYELLPIGGTSCATAYVTGVAALIKSRYPNLTATQIKAAIMEGVTPVAALSGKCVTGGRLNALNALQIAQGLSETLSVTGDFSGDGKDDWALVQSYPQSQTMVQVRSSVGNPNAEESTWWNSGVGNFNLAAVQGNVCTGDFNGDGKDDIAMMYDYGNNQASMYVLISQGSSFSCQLWYAWSSGTFNANSVVGRFTAGDFNGDGKDDIAMMYNHGNAQSTVYTLLSQGSSFSNHVWYAWSAGGFNAISVTERFTAGDFNGDGRDDIAMMYDYGNAQSTVYTLFSQGNSFVNQVWYAWSAGGFNAGSVTGRFAAGDFNGDGKDDVAMMYDYGSNRATIYALISQGSSFSNQAWYSWSAGTFNANAVTGRFTAGDFNVDGKEDVLSCYLYSYGDIKPFIQYSTGSGFANIQEWQLH